MFLATIVLLPITLLGGLYHGYLLHVSNTTLTRPRGDSHTRSEVLNEPKRTAKPRGQEYEFPFSFERLDSCPDSIEFNWGFREGKQVQTLTYDQKSDCTSFTLKAKHIFSTTFPRRILVTPLLKGQSIVKAPLCVWWPQGTPCDGGEK